MQGNIAKWRKKEGDKVSAGDILCEIETVRDLSPTCSGLCIKEVVSGSHKGDVRAGKK